MKTKYALFSQSGAFSRFEELDPTSIPSIPLADDGLPRAVPTGEAPECPDGKMLSYSRAGWHVVDTPEPEAPQSVTRRQLRRWLVKHGIALDSIRSEFAKLSEPERSLALIDYDDAGSYEIDNPLVTMLAAKLKVDAKAAFRAASKE